LMNNVGCGCGLELEVSQADEIVPSPYMRSGLIVPLSGLVYELSKYSKCPLAKATM
jgi:hypothetical protein